MAGGVQLDLFDSARQSIRALQMALERIDLGKAAKLLRRVIHRESLDWETAALDFLQHNRIPRDLDAGCRLWEEFRSAPFFPRIPRFSAQEIRKSFFSRLLAANASQRHLLTTAEGISIGWLYLQAGYPGRARRSLEKELSHHGESPRRRLDLAHANLQLGETTAARVHFREALLLGWDRLDAESIPDPELLRFLRGADDPDWAVVEACLEGMLPIARFASRQAFAASPYACQLEKDLYQAPPREPADMQRHFHACLVASQNRRWLESDRLVQVRLRMKELHPRHYAAHMKSLETRNR